MTIPQTPDPPQPALEWRTATRAALGEHERLLAEIAEHPRSEVINALADAMHAIEDDDGNGRHIDYYRSLAYSTVELLPALIYDEDALCDEPGCGAHPERAWLTDQDAALARVADLETRLVAETAERLHMEQVMDEQQAEIEHLRAQVGEWHESAVLNGKEVQRLRAYATGLETQRAAVLALCDKAQEFAEEWCRRHKHSHPNARIYVPDVRAALAAPPDPNHDNNPTAAGDTGGV